MCIGTMSRVMLGTHSFKVDSNVIGQPHHRPTILRLITKLSSHSLANAECWEFMQDLVMWNMCQTNSEVMRSTQSANP